MEIRSTCRDRPEALHGRQSAFQSAPVYAKVGRTVHKPGRWDHNSMGTATHPRSLKKKKPAEIPELFKIRKGIHLFEKNRPGLKVVVQPWAAQGVAKLDCHADGAAEGPADVNGKFSANIKCSPRKAHFRNRYADCFAKSGDSTSGERRDQSRQIMINRTVSSTSFVCA